VQKASNPCKHGKQTLSGNDDYDDDDDDDDDDVLVPKR